MTTYSKTDVLCEASSMVGEIKTLDVYIILFSGSTIIALVKTSLAKQAVIYATIKS